MTVHAVIADPMKVHGTYRQGGRERIADLMELVGLKPST